MVTPKDGKADDVEGSPSGGNSNVDSNKAGPSWRTGNGPKKDAAKNNSFPKRGSFRGGHRGKPWVIE